MGWKLVRDGQREFCQAQGVSGRWRISPAPERALTKKLFEEASEFAELFGAHLEDELMSDGFREKDVQEEKIP